MGLGQRMQRYSLAHSSSSYEHGGKFTAQAVCAEGHTAVRLSSACSHCTKVLNKDKFSLHRKQNNQCCEDMLVFEHLTSALATSIQDCTLFYNEFYKSSEVH